MENDFCRKTTDGKDRQRSMAGNNLMVNDDCCERVKSKSVKDCCMFHGVVASLDFLCMLFLRMTHAGKA